MALQQLQFKTSSKTGTQYKDSTGSQLANLVMNGLKVAGQIGSSLEKQRMQEEADLKKEDEVNQKFIQNKLYQYQVDNPGKSFKHYEEYSKSGITQDEEYVKRFGYVDNADGTKSVKTITDAMGSNLYKENVSLFATRWTKEAGLSDEQILEKQRKLDEKSDNILYNDIVGSLADKKLEVNFENLDDLEKIDFLENNHNEMVKNKTSAEFASEAYKAKYGVLERAFQNDILNIKNKKRYKDIDNGLNSFMNNILKDSSINITDVNNAVEFANDGLPSDKEYKKTDIYKKVVNQIDSYIANNPEGFQNKTKEEILSSYPILKQIKDQTILERVSNQIDAIDLNTRTTNEAAKIANGSIDISSQNLAKTEDIKKSIDANYVSALNRKDPVGVEQAISISVKTNMPISSIENIGAALVNTEGADESLLFEQYHNVKKAQAAGYSLRNESGSKEMNAIEDIAESYGYDINTPDGFAKALAVKKTNAGSNIKVNMKSLGSLVADEIEQIEDPFLYSSVMQRASDKIRVGVPYEQAVKSALKDAKNQFSGTGNQDLRKIGISTPAEYQKALDFFTYKTKAKNKIVKIAMFGDGVVYYDEDGNSYPTTGDQVKKSIYNMKNNKLIPQHSTDKNSVYGGSVGGGNTATTLYFNDGTKVFSNRHFNDTTLEPIAIASKYVSSVLKPGESMEINEKTYNAIFGQDSNYIFKEEAMGGIAGKAKSALKLAGMNGSAISQAIIGKAKFRKTNDGTIVIDGLGGIYDFTKKDQDASMLSDDGSKNIVLSFSQNQLGQAAIPSNNKIKQANQTSRELGIPVNDVLLYGLYDVTGTVARNDIGNAYKIAKEQIGQTNDPDAGRSIMSLAIKMLKDGNPKYKVLEAENDVYAFGKNSLKLMNK